MTDRVYKTIGRQARKPSGWLGKMLFGHLAAQGHRPLTDWALQFLDV